MAATVRQSSPEATCSAQGGVGRARETQESAYKHFLCLILGTHIVKHGSLTVSNPTAGEAEAVGSLRVDQLV